MNIQSTNFNSPQFTSKLNPIPPSIIKTESGKLTLKEAKPSEIENPKFLAKLSEFFSKNFASNTDDPSWLEFSRMKSKDKKNFINAFIGYLQDIFKQDDGNMTLLVAKDKRNKIQGACLSYGYDIVDDAKNYTLYVDSIAVNKNFRRVNLGKKMLQKTMDANKKNSNFTDVFLVGEKRAYGFYKKLGFSKLNTSDYEQNKVASFIAIDRADYPKYTDFLTLPLKPEQPRWYSKVAKLIKDEWL